MSASSFSSPSDILCGCLEKAQLRTSKTSQNPGKRFYGCKKWKEGGCTFFMWAEPTSQINSETSSGMNNQDLGCKAQESEMKIVLLEAELKVLKMKISMLEDSIGKFDSQVKLMMDRMKRIHLFIVGICIGLILCVLVK
ncbi:GRF zinc finger containing protein [Striga asiatica]|uniref:GRF zinc finger containing protein n=1 Tax=Striga asiatica TaxID=4170 RepID=A0A5A7QW16_STRAF|nr:GRF zinc finger containing protein [Striga asiatica]GER49454.1 GRF zinc finger containing protein [Striga asiatica]